MKSVLMRLTGPRLGCLLLFLVFSAHPAHAQREGWWATASGGVVNVVQRCDSGALSLSCGPVSGWGLAAMQLGVGRQVAPSFGLGIEVAGREFQTFLSPSATSTVVTQLVKATATVFPLLKQPLFFQIGVGGGSFRFREEFGSTDFQETGQLWAVSMVVGAEWGIAGPIRAGPYVRLDYAELGEVEFFFRGLHQRLVSFGVAVTVR